MQPELIILSGSSAAFAVFCFILLTQTARRAWRGLGLRYSILGFVLFALRAALLMLAGLEHIPNSIFLLILIEVLLYAAIGLITVGIWHMFDVFYRKRMVVM